MENQGVELANGRCILNRRDSTKKKSNMVQKTLDRLVKESAKDNYDFIVISRKDANVLIKELTKVVSKEDYGKN